MSGQEVADSTAGATGGRDLGPPAIFICGINQGQTHKYACPYCDFESDDLEDFATSMCWNCVYGGWDED